MNKANNYSLYTWYKGEDHNPYTDDRERPLAAGFWEYEMAFHLAFTSSQDNSKPLALAYKEWKDSTLNEHLSGKSANPYTDITDWHQSFETGKWEQKIILNENQKAVVKQYLDGTYSPFFSSPEEQQSFNEVIDMAEALMFKLDAVEESGSDLVRWFWGKCVQ